ncbi:hypothetical protein SARC_17451, partial [Sphaeroforma arctica JP610]
DDPQAAHARRGAPWTFDAQKFRDALITIKKGKGVRKEGHAPALSRDVSQCVWYPCGWWVQVSDMGNPSTEQRSVEW